MSQPFIQSVKKNAQFVMTYLLTLVDGTQYTLVAVSPDEVMFQPGEDADHWVGRLFNGGEIKIPFANLMSVEPDRYRVTANWGGNGHKTREMSEEKLCDYVANRGGNGDNISKIKDSEGNTVYDKYEGSDRKLKGT